MKNAQHKAKQVCMKFIMSQIHAMSLSKLDQNHIEHVMCAIWNQDSIRLKQLLNESSQMFLAKLNPPSWNVSAFHDMTTN
jgi:hypothetical protein